MAWTCLKAALWASVGTKLPVYLFLGRQEKVMAAQLVGDGPFHHRESQTPIEAIGKRTPEPAAVRIMVIQIYYLQCGHQLYFGLSGFVKAANKN